MLTLHKVQKSKDDFQFSRDGGMAQLSAFPESPSLTATHKG